MDDVFRPRLQFRNLRVLLTRHGSQTTPDGTLMELTNLLACDHLERLDIEICIPETLASDPEFISQQSVNKKSPSKL